METNADDQGASGMTNEDLAELIVACFDELHECLHRDFDRIGRRFDEAEAGTGELGGRLGTALASPWAEFEAAMDDHLARLEVGLLRLENGVLDLRDGLTGLRKDVDALLRELERRR